MGGGSVGWFLISDRGTYKVHVGGVTKKNKGNQLGNPTGKGKNREGGKETRF